MATQLKDMFEARYIPEPNSGCWLWLGSVNEHGYGTMRNKYAHRISYQLHRGEVGALCVLHRCDTPACVNPDHLFLGTRADNVRDCHSKGRMFVQTKKHRMARGERVYGSKLTAEQVAEIRSRYAAGETQIPLAQAYGVTQTTIQCIVAGKTWKHVPLSAKTAERIIRRRDNPAETRKAIVAVYRQHPNWRSYQIANEIGCDPGYVRTILREHCGVVRRGGRPFKSEQWVRT